MVRILSGVQQFIRKYKKIASEYRKYYGKEPTDREMRAFLSVSEKLEDIKKSARMGQIQSLNEPKNQGIVLQYRFKDGKTLREIGEISGITIEVVRQLENKAIRALRIPSRCRKFKPYYKEYLQAACYRHVGLRSFQRTWTSEVEREVLGRQLLRNVNL